MNIKRQPLLKTASVLLILVVTLLGQAPTAMQVKARQHSAGEGERIGWGDFPRLPVVMPGVDGATLAVYIVEGDAATQLAVLEGTRADTNHAEVRLSPDGRYVACLRAVGDDLRPVLEVIDTQESQRTLIAERPVGMHDKGVSGETLTSVAWLDDQHLLYAKVRWPDRAEQEVSWEAGTPLPIQGEVWLSDVAGKEQRRLASGPIYRVLGAASGGNILYVTRLIPGREAEREEGFALLDVKSGEMKNLWPAEERGVREYRNFALATLPDGTLRVLFATVERADTAISQPPVIWLADPDSGQAKTIGMVEQSRTILESDLTIYDMPLNLIWSPYSEHTFIYLANGVAVGGVWRVDLDKETTTPLGKAETWGRTGVQLLAWTPEGIVLQSQDTLQLLGEDGEIRGEIHFCKDDEEEPAVMQVSSVVVDWDVPHVHQIRDTSNWFDGRWACAPTSMVMALAYYKRLSPHPITVSYPAPHTSQYGWYVSTEAPCLPPPPYPVLGDGYTHVSACQGTHSFNECQYNGIESDPNERYVAGAFGACMLDGGGNAGKMFGYANKHDVGDYFTQKDEEVTADAVRSELRGGAVVILRTSSLTGGGHIVVARGYTSDGYFIINDPAGDFHASGYPYNAGGAGARYTWAEMSPTWYIALYGPKYLPDVYKSSYSSDGSTITVHNGSEWTAKDVDVCLMNSNGGRTRTETHAIPVKGSWNLSLNNVFGYADSFSGSAVVMPDQTGITTMVENESDAQSERTNYIGVLAGDFGSLGWEQTGTTLYAPTVKRQYYGRSSTIHITNIGHEGTGVDVYYYDDNGSVHQESYSDLEPNEKATIVPSISGNGCGSSGTVCSAKLVADNGQPLAGVVREYNAADDKAVTTHNLFSVGNSPIHFPVVKYDYYDMSTGLRIQNVGGSGSWVTVYFYPREGEGGGSCYLSDYVPSFAASTFFDSNCPGNDFVGSAVVVANQPLVGMANEVGLGQKKAYSSYQNGSRTVLGPLVYHNYGSWTAGIAVQNISFYEATVDLEYYDTDGDWVGHQLNQTIGGKRMDFFFAPQTGFKGSVLITADEDIVAVVNVVNTAGGGDAEAIYNASNR